MKLWKIASLSCMMLILSLSVWILPILNINELQTDTSAINDITNHCIANWTSGSFSSIPTYDMEFTILGSEEQILYQTPGSNTQTIHSAIQNGGTIIDVISRDNIRLGKVLFTNQWNTKLAAAKNKLLYSVLFFTACLALTAMVYLFYLNHMILKPFSKLKAFSANIARGNFDSPLLMDKDNIFGTFSESFDIMREELLKARENEHLANQSKKELIASLSHDIKTPVASIIAVSEVMLVKSGSGEEKDKLKTILGKAEQINALISNLFHAALEDLQTLPVLPIAIYSRELSGMIENSDYEKRAVINKIPDCAILCDPLRLQQVFDNIIGNSYKYAGTDIIIHSEIKDESLSLTFTDFGKGLPNEELLLLFSKFYRGSNAEGKSGTGLGLYICQCFLGRMDGTILAMNTENGFCIGITLTLA